jgi:hypothetical protein
VSTPIEVNHAVDWWAGAAGALLGAFIGSCVPLAWYWLSRRKERRGELIAMQAEMYHAQQAMRTLMTAGIAAPLYQLPLTTFERALPKLIGDGKLSPNEIAALVEYVMRAEELNRGLDRAVDAAAGSDEATISVAVKREYDRNFLKAEHIVDEEQKRFGGETLFAAAERALYRLIPTIPPEPDRPDLTP